MKKVLQSYMGKIERKKIQMEQSDSDLGIMSCLRPKSHIEKYGKPVEYLKVGSSPW